MSDWIKQQTIDVLRQSIADAPKQPRSGAGFLNLDTRIVSELCDTWESEATLRAENELMREALDNLLAFHDHTHPRHDALFEDYQEDCIANERHALSADLLDDLQTAARNTLAQVAK